VLCVPIVHHDHLLGLLTLSAGAANRFGDGDAALLGRFSVAVANAIANAQRYEAAVFLLDLGTEDSPAA
jgi:GAF domain-containing protein